MLHIGVRADTDPREVRYIVVANVAAWAGFAVAIAGILIYFATGQPLTVPDVVLTVAGGPASLILGALGYPRAARIVLLGTAAIAIFNQGLGSPPAFRSEVLYLVVLSGVWFILPPRDGIIAWVVTALCVAGYVGLNIVGSHVTPTITYPQTDLARGINEGVTILLIIFFSVFARRRALAAEGAIEAERARSESLLRNMLPESIAQQLKDAPGAIAKGHDEVTVLFADIVGFTPLSQTMTPHELVRLLNEIFSTFDAMAQRHGLEKIKTIGDAYMVVGGAPHARADHASAIAAMALEMRAAMARFHTGINLRIGMHTGPAVAGVIGTAKYSYDLWGDTVNTAARMESHGEPGRIQLTAECRRALGERFAVEDRGTVPIKGKGPMQTFWLVGAAGSP
jgi:class 3 adenylate cyclase